MSNYPPSPNQGYQPPYQQQPFGQQPYQQPMPPVKKSKTWLIVLLVIGGSVLALVAMCVISALAYHFTKTELPVADADRQVVVDIQRLESFVEGYRSNPQHETIEKYRYLDDSHEVVYEYEDPHEEGIFLTCTVTVEKNLSDANTTYLAESAGTELGASFAGADVKFVDRDDIFRWGDKSRFTIIEAENMPGGNFFIARQGNRVISVCFAGVYFDDPGSVRELLMPVLSKLESYEP